MKNIVLQPSFYDKFECIGGMCKNNCCHSWNVGITKQELKNMKRNIKTEEFRKTFENAFEKYQYDRFSYKIKFDENKRCKFLDENGLCKVYKEMGHENMSLTCQIFPRETTYYMKKYECFLDIDCEEVVRLLLQEKEGIQLEVIEREVTDVEKNGAARINNEILITNSIYHYWTEFKILLLGVLQNREYLFGERMVVLGMAIKKIDEMIREGVENTKVIPNYIQQFVADFNDSKNKDMYSKLFEKVDKSGRIRLFQHMTYYRNNTRAKEIYEIQQKITNRVDAKIKVNGETHKKIQLEIGQKKNQSFNIEYNVEKYQQAMKEFKQFIKDREWWIENVMIEGFLADRFPFRIDGGIWKNYCAMALMYSMMLFMWTCCIEKDSTEEDFIYYTSECARTLFNNNSYLTELEEQLNKTESETLAHMAMLVL